MVQCQIPLSRQLWAWRQGVPSVADGAPSPHHDETKEEEEEEEERPQSQYEAPKEITVRNGPIPM